MRERHTGKGEYKRMICGKNVYHRQTGRRIYKRAHTKSAPLRDHSQRRTFCDKIPAEKARLEIEKTNNRIYEASGIYPSYVRPPFGAWIKDMELSVTMLPVFWDVDTLDWQSKNIDSILSIAQKQVHDGSIILMHDGYQTSVDAALKIADLFTEKGYVFVTADQLLLT